MTLSVSCLCSYRVVRACEHVLFALPAMRDLALSLQRGPGHVLKKLFTGVTPLPFDFKLQVVV